MRRDELVDIIRNRSVVTWKHINLQGEYDFSEEKLKDSMGLNVAEFRAKVLPVVRSV